MGDLAPEELEALGPDAEPEFWPPPRWTWEEYLALMVARGVQDGTYAISAGYSGYLELAEGHGLLEKRPNTEPWDLLLVQREADQ
ncbi:hypothetical protein ACIBEJ_31585 [Nonomuraea sp. NPDC050790]|uniref:hypothetical protein n=1 Tax=Nonomuraea sp. NPDC050790 TaxID=3364371 RepID=UPI0037ADDA51